MTHKTSFKESIAENTADDGTINWDAVKIPDLDLADVEAITDVPPHSEDALMARFGDDAAKIRQIIQDSGLINCGLSDIEWFLTDTTQVKVVEIYSSEKDSPLRDANRRLQCEYEAGSYPKVALIITTNPKFHKVGFKELDSVVNYSNVILWAYQYNDELLPGTIRLTAILAN